MEGGKFLYYPEASPVILQLECIEDGRLLVYSLLALIGWLPCLSSVGRAVIISGPRIAGQLFLTQARDY